MKIEKSIIFPKKRFLQLINNNYLKSEEYNELGSIFSDFSNETKSLTITIKMIKTFLKKHQTGLTNEIKINLLISWLKKIKNEVEFVSFLDFIEKVPFEYITKELASYITISINKYYKALTVDEMKKFLRFQLKTLNVCSLFDMNKYIIHKLQYQPKKELFDFFVEVQFMSNNFIYNLSVEDELIEIMQNYQKDLIYKIFVDNSIFLDQSLKEYFKEEINFFENDENYNIEKTINDELSCLVNSQLNHYLKNLDLNKIMFLNENQDKYVNYFSRSFIKETLENKLKYEKNNMKIFIDNIEFFAKDKKHINVLIQKLDNFFVCLNIPVFEFTDKKKFFFKILFIYQEFLEKKQKFYLQYLIPEHIKMIAENYIKNFENIFLSTFYEESINDTLFNQEEIEFIKQKNKNIIYNVLEKDISEEEFEKILNFVELINKVNIGDESFFKNFILFFNFYLKRTNEKLFSRILKCVGDFNISVDTFGPKIEEYVEEYLQAKNTLDFKLDTLVNIIFVLVLGKRFHFKFWKEVSQNLEIHMKHIQNLDNNSKMILFLCQKILQKNSVNFLNKIEIIFPHDFSVLENNQFFEELQLYFKYLFINNVELNKKINFVNINYIQSGKVMLLLERQYVLGFSEIKRGSISLIVEFLNYFYHKIEIYPITTFHSFEKRNEKMHELRKKLIGWNIDYGEREKYFDQAYDIDYDKIKI